MYCKVYYSNCSVNKKYGNLAAVRTVAAHTVGTVEQQYAEKNIYSVT